MIDHNVVLGNWHGRGPGRKPVRSEETARQAARSWLREHPEDGLVTPVRLEFIAGTKDREEQRLGDLFLGEFPLFDDGRILPEDWGAAERFARRIRGTGGARGVIDCLILALCVRLHADLYSLDKGARLH
ncbi:MAG TPA: PIN domain-containing protein [Fimbriiglobus sp.]|nr:PIN domain-containing protein [Fimbriiglobus sp.]